VKISKDWKGRTLLFPGFGKVGGEFFQGLENLKG
jgi:hypothetical protein